MKFDVAEAADGKEAHDQCETQTPDVNLNGYGEFLDPQTWVGDMEEHKFIFFLNSDTIIRHDRIVDLISSFFKYSSS